MDEELAKTEITSLYKKILGRIPDNNGLEFYTKQLRSGKMTLDGVEKALHESDEYLDIQSAPQFTSQYSDEEISMALSGLPSV